MDLWGGVFCSVTALLSAWLWKKRDAQYRSVFAMALCVAGILFCDCIAWFYRGAAGALGVLKASNFFAFVFTVTVNIPFAFYVYSSAGEKAKFRSFGIAPVLAGAAFSLVLVVVTQWNGLCYYFDESNFYHRNDRYFWLLSLSYFVQAFFILAVLIKKRKSIAFSRFLVISSLILLPALSVFVQTFVYGYSLSSIAAALSIMLCFLERLYGQAHDLECREKTIARLKEEIDSVKILHTKQLYPPPTSPPRAFARLQAFGEFKIFIGESPVKFRYSRTKELLAVLTDRKGAFCSNEMLVAVLWEDEAKPKKTDYLRRLRKDLLDTLDSFGQKDIILCRRGEMALDTSKVQCDYYDFLSGRATVPYSGEYMRQYSWAEETNARLHWQAGERIVADTE